MVATQDVVALFIAEFQATKGNIIDWSLVSDESVSLENVEYSVLPSGVHAINQDVIYITTDSYQGVAVYRRVSTDEEGMRGARMLSVGVLVASTMRPRPWNHIPALKRFATSLEDNYKERKPLEDYFEQYKHRGEANIADETWNGWEDELSGATMEHPAFHLSHILRVLGISSLTLFKHALGRRRILIYTRPPVESACLLAELAAVISNGEEGSAKVRTPRISVLGLVGLMDLTRIEKETSKENGWIACTTDAIFLEKPAMYDLLIDLTSSSPSRPHRPSLSVSRLSDNGSGKKSWKLQTIRFTWSDVRLWKELESILEVDAESGHAHPHPVTSKSRWTDPWDLYEDVCLVCAGVWAGWSPPPQIKLESSQGLNTTPSSSNSDPEATLHSIDMSTASTRAGPSMDSKNSHRPSVDRRLGEPSSTPTTRVRVTTLSLLSTFHNHIDFLQAKLTEVLEKYNASSSNTRSIQGDALVLSPKDVVVFDLGAGSELDARFIEWLGETRGTKVKVKRGWRDIFGFIFGFS